MPTYQYRCTACGHDLEAVQSFSDAALTECPACTGQLRKVFSSVGLVFKGSGFYKTDSRSGSSSGVPARPKESSTSSSDGDSSSKSSASAESSTSGGTSSSTASSDSSSSTSAASSTAAA
ncbi:FmdB family zinc ribbon protein [Parafrankia elaeagni]|uniref:FmdB family zinc ribbon protein n=1 Tax=Parafrankia elaeagni TaxID=222534 RepID=UPI0009FCDE3B